METPTPLGGEPSGTGCGNQPSAASSGSLPSLRSLLPQWARAARAAALALWTTYPKGVFVRQMWTTLLSVWSALTARRRYGSQTVERLVSSRLEVCRRCPIYDSALQTCGTPGSIDRLAEPPIQVGCWCFLPVAARDPEKACWLTAVGAPEGWEENWRHQIRQT